uniref:Uncharacterized protein n=1 Tax=Arundo donax TaxID=35708 RepID=A0A0A9B598_ARUDO
MLAVASVAIYLFGLTVESSMCGDTFFLPKSLLLTKSQYLLGMGTTSFLLD